MTPGVAKNGRTVRIGAVADLHCSPASQGEVHRLLADAATRIDLLLLAGDLTDYGLVEEAKLLAQELKTLNVPMVGVLGNHDYESGRPDEVKQILADAGLKVLDGDTAEVLGVGIAGVKGFAGGFGRGTLGPWGEDIVKQFVQEAVNEALKLESALARLRMRERIALLHYSPIETTVEGEPREIFPFLGCGRLAEPLSRYPVTAVFHGHAHRGSLEGRIGDTIVYNVAMPLLRHRFPQQPAVRILELFVADDAISGGDGLQEQRR